MIKLNGNISLLFEYIKKQLFIILILFSHYFTCYSSLIGLLITYTIPVYILSISFRDFNSILIVLSRLNIYIDSVYCIVLFDNTVLFKQMVAFRSVVNGITQLNRFINVFLQNGSVRISSKYFGIQKTLRRYKYVQRNILYFLIYNEIPNSKFNKLNAVD